MRFGLGRGFCNRRRLILDNGKIAIADHELENRVDGAARGVGPQRRGPGDIRLIGLNVGEWRQAAQIGDKIELTEAAQLTQNVERLVGVPQHLRPWPERDRIALLAVEVVGLHRREVDPFEVAGVLSTRGHRLEIEPFEIACVLRAVRGARLALPQQLLKRLLALGGMAGRNGVA